MNLIPDSLHEIAATLKRNKLRTALTGFAVAWGVLLLVVLLSSGEGFRNAMVKNMRAQAENIKTISVHPGYTSIAYKGYKKRRKVLMTYQDVLRVVDDHKDVVDAFSLLTSAYSGFGLTYENKSTNTNNGTVYGTVPGMINMGYQLYAGRFVNESDIHAARKVMVIEKENAIELFGNVQAAIGKQISWQSNPYTVVGVINKSSGGGWQQAYIPITTLQLIYHKSTRYIDEFTLLCNSFESATQAKPFCEALKRELKVRYNVSPEDESGIYVNNGLESGETTRKIFAGISLFLWLIGFSTLLIGLIGVANIMQITVAERSAEIGIRKALGAKPWAIILMILRESVLVTVLAGCIGLVVGVGLMEVVSTLMTRYEIGTTNIEGTTLTLFRDPLISFGTATVVLILMVVCGAIAGYFPARRAVRIPAVEAMRK